MPGDLHGPAQPKQGTVSRSARETLESIRPSSLPPELGHLDFNWDDDPVSPEPVVAHPAVAKLELDLDLDEGDRPTAVPEMPMEVFVARAMAAVDQEEQNQASVQPRRGFEVADPGLSAGACHMPDAFGAQHSFPPTLPSNRVALSPFAESAEVGLQSIDPLAVDLSEMDAEQSDRYLSATDPPHDSPVPKEEPTGNGAPRESTALRESDTVPPSHGNTRSNMKDRYAMGDFTGALAIAETLLAQDSADLDAQRFATSCRDVLTQMYLSRLGGLDQIISVVLPPEELRWLNLDHRAGFLLSLVDDASTVEELLDISGMSRLDALKILATLREQRAILLRSR